MSNTDGTPLTFKGGEALFRQGEPAKNVFVIEKGHVMLSRNVFRESVVLETLGPGNICGEIAFAHGAKYQTTAEAIDGVEVLAIPQEAMPKVLETKEILLKVVTKLAARLAHINYQVSVLAFRSAEGRVMNQLRKEAEVNGALNGGAFAPIPFDLPDVVCLEKNVVDAVLRELLSQRFIEIDNSGHFRILDTPAFDRLLSYYELADRFNQKK